MRQAVKWIVLFGILTASSGCWDNKDINHRSLPVVMGIGDAAGDYEVFLQIPEPVDSKMRVKIVSEKDKTITKAVDKISENLETQVDLLHLKLILIHSRCAERGLDNLFDFFMRVRDISPKALVVISDEELGSFFRNVQRSMKPTGTNLNDFFEKNAGWNPQIALTRIWQVYRSVHSFTRDVAVPIVKSGKSTLIEHMGSGVIRNGKLVGRIDPDETLLFNTFTGQSGQGKIEVLNRSSVMIDQVRVHRRSGIIGGVPWMNVRMDITVNLLELRQGTTIEEVKKELAELLDRRFERMFARVQAERSDIFALGQHFRNLLPRDRLREWRDRDYPRLKVDFKTYVVIEDYGHVKAN
ncbi:hypothetical protein J19TS2_14380 [Cohnella xylanilytica]|uniref:Ger(X)C family spore germination protein n=1 Tax=Cohnella xylanilytica TaxID=557555 RepID=A0A841TYT6_9BACL|nr:Ger(x)C family spore germination protein [Cohnella xylanilytica]MBB6692262.1 Ger(x)C family spore germination protein [Cohnella xylanilytica]GIO11883.1 hypothetical protein J19TS2_14380 [Cohnella xylanilytica]